MDERELTLVDIIKLIQKYLLLIALCTILGGVIGIILSQRIPPTYEAYTTVMVGNPEQYTEEIETNVDYLNFNQKVVANYREIIQSKSIVQKVIENLELNEDYYDFMERVKVENLEETDLIKVTVSDKDPTLIENIAEEIGIVFTDYGKDTLKVDNIQVIDSPEGLTRIVFPTRTLFMRIGIVLGGLLGLVLSFVKALTDSTIKGEDDFEEELGLPVLGKIPYAKK